MSLSSPYHHHRYHQYHQYHHHLKLTHYLLILYRPSLNWKLLLEVNTPSQDRKVHILQGTTAFFFFGFSFLVFFFRSFFSLSSHNHCCLHFLTLGHRDASFILSPTPRRSYPQCTLMLSVATISSLGDYND